MQHVPSRLIVLDDGKHHSLPQLFQAWYIHSIQKITDKNFWTAVTAAIKSFFAIRSPYLILQLISGSFPMFQIMMYLQKIIFYT